MRGSNLIKLLKTLDLLSKPEGTTIEELQNVLEIDRRSVYRQIALIQDLGFPLYDDKVPLEKRKRWKLMDGYLKRLPNIKVPNVELSLSEMVALYLLKAEGKVYKGTEIEKAIDSALSKIGLFASNDMADKLNKIKGLFSSSLKLVKDYSGKEEIIESLTEAMLKNKTCIVRYLPFTDNVDGKVYEYEIDPLSFFEHNGGLYIFVRMKDSGLIRMLAVERIQELEATNDTFEYPKEFDPEELLAPAFGIVYDDPIEAKIWFSADQARYIKERKWAKEQKITNQSDGSIILEMKTSGWWDVKKWVLSFGAEAELLEPTNLRKDIMEEIKGAGVRYRM